MGAPNDRLCDIERLRARIKELLADAELLEASARACRRQARQSSAIAGLARAEIARLRASVASMQQAEDGDQKN